MPSEVVTPCAARLAGAGGDGHTIAYDVAPDNRLPARWAALDMATLVVTGAEVRSAST